MYSSSVLDKGPRVHAWCDSRRITYPQVRTVQEKKLLDRSLDVTSRRRNGNSIFWRNFKLVRIVYDFSTYSRTPVTRTLKGNEKQFKLARFRVIGIDCKIQFAMLNLIDTDFSALQCTSSEVQIFNRRKADTPHLLWSSFVLASNYI